MNAGNQKRIAVIGSGAMGHGIARMCALAGYSVIMTDLRQELLDNAMSKISKSLESMMSKGRITEADRDRVLNLDINTTTDAGEAVKGADVIIEAVPEIMDLKKRVFKAVSDIAGPDAVVATNTSTMSITELSSAVNNPARFAGMHFFNPVTAMKLVEIIYGGSTCDAAVDTLCDIALKCGKIPVKVLKDRPGFIVNRINAPIQALLSAILDERKIRPDEIDAPMKKIGFRMAPFETADFVGLDVFSHTLRYYSETLSHQYKPGRYLADRIIKNELGMKSGKGIYSWGSGRAEIDTDAVSSEITPVHFLSVQINEAVRVFNEGIARSAEDIDNAVICGMNAIAGPFNLAAGMQPEQIADSLNYLAGRYGLTILRPEPEILDGSFKSLRKQ